MVVVPESIEVVPLRRTGATTRVCEHEHSRSKREAEGSEPENENQNVEPSVFLNGNCGLELRLDSRPGRRSH